MLNMCSTTKLSLEPRQAFYLCVDGIQTRALSMLGKCFTTKLQPKSRRYLNNFQAGAIGPVSRCKRPNGVTVPSIGNDT